MSILIVVLKVCLCDVTASKKYKDLIVYRMFYCKPSINVMILEVLSVNKFLSDNYLKLIAIGGCQFMLAKILILVLVCLYMLNVYLIVSHMKNTLNMQMNMVF